MFGWAVAGGLFRATCRCKYWRQLVDGLVPRSDGDWLVTAIDVVIMSYLGQWGVSLVPSWEAELAACSLQCDARCRRGSGEADSGDTAQVPVDEVNEDNAAEVRP